MRKGTIKYCRLSAGKSMATTMADAKLGPVSVFHETVVNRLPPQHEKVAAIIDLKL